MGYSNHNNRFKMFSPCRLSLCYSSNGFVPVLSLVPNSLKTKRLYKYDLINGILTGKEELVIDFLMSNRPWSTRTRVSVPVQESYTEWLKRDSILFPRQKNGSPRTTHSIQFSNFVIVVWSRVKDKFIWMDMCVAGDVCGE